MDILRREAIYLWYYFSIQFRQIFSYWVLGMVLGSVVSVFLKDYIHNAFRSFSEKRLGIVGIWAASALGIASPLCMYGTIPIAASFSKSGIKDDWLAAFMMASILLNPQLIIYSAVLGSAALFVRIISCYLCVVAAGLLIQAFCRDRQFFNFSGFEEPKSHDTDPNIFLRFLKNLGRKKLQDSIFWPVSLYLQCFSVMCLRILSVPCLAVTKHGAFLWQLRSECRFMPAAAERSPFSRHGWQMA